MRTAVKIRSAEPDRLDYIYRVAAQIICEKGFDATSMNDIADALGITKAGVYHHIPGKKDLLFRVMNFGLDALDREVIFPAREIVDAEQRLGAIIDSHVRLITSRSIREGSNPVTIVVEETAGLTPAHRLRINQRKRAYVDLVRETLLELKQEGKLSEIDVTTATFSLLGMIHWLARWYHPQGRLTPDQVASEIAKLAIGGLLKTTPNIRAVKTNCPPKLTARPDRQT
ncbi:MAG: TetR/AcrR family transcriptional regulator [Acidobacteriota bacterium]